MNTNPTATVKLAGVLIQKKEERSPFRSIRRAGRRVERFDEELGAYVQEIAEERPDLVLFTLVQRSKENPDAPPVFLNCAAEYLPHDLERGDLVEITAAREVRTYTDKAGKKHTRPQWNVGAHRLIFAAAAFKATDRNEQGPRAKSYDGPGEYAPSSPKMPDTTAEAERREIARRAAEKQAAEQWVRACREEVATAHAARKDAEAAGAPAEEVESLKAAEMDAHRAAKAADAAFDRLR